MARTVSAPNSGWWRGKGKVAGRELPLSRISWQDNRSGWNRLGTIKARASEESTAIRAKNAVPQPQRERRACSSLLLPSWPGAANTCIKWSSWCGHCARDRRQRLQLPCSATPIRPQQWGTVSAPSGSLARLIPTSYPPRCSHDGQRRRV